ncbi:TIR domain-containing protein [Mycoplasmatota bacterium]|nr:TIR domain-containing protein [Mycoplasmatota bacterium]
MKLFISYHLADTKSVNKIKEKLNAKALNYYSVPEDKDFTGWHNEEIREYILSKMDDCSVLLCIVGRETYKRPHVDYEIHQALKGGVGKRLGIVTVLLENREDSINDISYDTFPNRLYDNEHYIILIQNASLEDQIFKAIDLANNNRNDKNISINNKRKCMKLPNKYYGI